ncbi:hypothetical protein A4W93_17655 [Piscinibacter gummiphilus]|uniref:Uncharacterized protein n=2 Tax=Piscinibacter gummiphilus TaxID=946333 RepID=A0A1W6LBF8_9BURK|nr:hypothetical protein [Piscinibacter gummiphilus]ARN21576.1 hypothetical protein A4W93_17655 [Piscinibacter gummiphilus]ATU66260.1 hypothetical protein CPZ87_17740 [Piscinibacter gummiphilus]GLS97845.1 hypothetical protein GCM10007918_51370 [Piscinibacter gummiphilus]
MPYMLESHTKLAADERLKKDSRLLGKLAQDIARVIRELHALGNNVVPTSSYMVQLMSDLRATSTSTLATRDNLIGLVEVIGQQFPKRIQQPNANPNDLASTQKVTRARTLCGQAAQAIRTTISPDNDALTRVFGADHVGTARNVLLAAATSLDQLAVVTPGWDLVYDTTLTSADMAATGTPKCIRFSDVLFENGRAPLTLLLHEATHTLESHALQTRDYIYRDHKGFLTAPAEMKLKNAAHFEELGWQLLENKDHRTFVPVTDIMAIVTMTVTTAWIMSTWLANKVKGIKGQYAGDSEFKRNASRILGLTLHKHAKETGWPWTLGVPEVEFSVVDEITATQRSMALSSCMTALKQNALDGFDPDPTSVETAVDSALLRLIGHVGADAGLRKSHDKSLRMIKALSALYLLDVKHYLLGPQEASEPQDEGQRMQELRMHMSSGDGPDAVMDRYNRLLEGHVRRVVGT